ncbi:hypothetical protein QUF56_08850 [Ureibacillus composti]|nr:hypothetical protein [Ureibacillus composti]
MADYVILVLGIVLIASTIPITAIITTYLSKQSKLKLEVLKYEIDLEKFRKESYIIETEKLRLEIEYTREKLALNQPFKSISQDPIRQEVSQETIELNRK